MKKQSGIKYTGYKKYETVREWWKKEGRGKFPLQVPHAISRLQKESGLNFQTAFEALVEAKKIILLSELNTEQSTLPKVLLIPFSLSAEEALTRVKQHFGIGKNQK